jgi:hypothetical protein
VKERIEIRDGVEFRVVTLRPDPRSTPSATRERTLFQALSTGQKKAHIQARIAKAKKRRRKRR